MASVKTVYDVATPQAIFNTNEVKTPFTKTMEIGLTFPRYCVIIYSTELPAATSRDEPDSADGRSTASGYLISEVVRGKTSIQCNG